MADCEVTGSTEERVTAAAQRVLSGVLRARMEADPDLAPPRHFRNGPLAVEVEVALGFAIELREARDGAGRSRKRLADRAGVPIDIVNAPEDADGVAARDTVIPVTTALGMRPMIELERPAKRSGSPRGG